MEPADGRPKSFEGALLAFEAHLKAKRWDEAARAGEVLAELSERYRLDGVMLPPETLRRAQAMYQHCTEMALAWGETLHQEAQSAGSSSRAIHTYSQMDGLGPPRLDPQATSPETNEPA